MSDRRTAPLISAKHAIPPPRATWVRRPRLHGPLCDSARLTVVVAPAGWGKTTLLTQWAHDPAETRGIVWVSLDDADSDPVRFWTYVLSALQRDVAGVSGAPLAALLTAGLTPVDLALPTLLNELTVLDSAHVLVLDDYHLIDHDDVHESLEYLLTYLPATLRVVIASRSDPRLPLARMRVRGELAELRAADLGFSTEEGAELLGAAGVDAPTAAALWERTEGWAAGLQLAALTFDASHQRAALRGDDRHILDYLSTEVLDRLPVDHQDLLVRTAVLERISGPLCDAVLDRTGSAAVLSELDHANLFVTPLDPRRDWYRCHRLFRDTLLHRLEARDPMEAGRVRLRAADWFLQRGYVAEAVGLRIDAGDADGAAELLRSRVPFFLETGALSTHLHLGRRLPASQVSRNPGLCVALAWAAGLNGQFSRMRSWLDAAEPLIRATSPTLDGWRTLRGAAAAVRAVEVGVARADAAQAVAAAALAVELECDPDLAGYVVARTVLGAMLGFAGRSDEAIPFLDDAWARAQALGLPPLLGLQAASILASALFETDHLDRLRRLFAEVGAAMAAAENAWASAVAPGIARLRTVEGRLAHRDGEFGAARTVLRHAVELARTFGETPGLVTALTALAEVELDDRHPAGAAAALREAREVIATEPALPHFVRLLDEVQQRADRHFDHHGTQHGGITIEELTDREHAVLRALAGDATQREIAASLYLSINTVKGYIKILYRKLGVSTRHEAVRQARILGLL